MNVETGQVYPSIPDALRAGEEPDKLVEIVGTPEQVQKVSRAVKDQAKTNRRAANKRARKSRKANR